MLDHIKIFTSANNGEEILTFPFPPKDLPDITDEWGHEEFITNDAAMTLIGQRKRKRLTLELYLPVKTKFKKAEPESVSGEKYIEFWQKWSERRVPMRLVITKGGQSILNIAYTIDSLEYHWNKIEDIEATVEISEYIFEEDLQEQPSEPAYNWESVRIKINGRLTSMKGANINGNYILPVRELLETVGFVVLWHCEEKKIYFGKEEADRLFGADFELYDGTSYAYARDIAAEAGLGIDWDSENRIIEIGG